MRRIVNISCSRCHRLTEDRALEGPEGVVFLHGNHHGETDLERLDDLRDDAGGRSQRFPSVIRYAAPLEDLATDKPIPCHCRRCGRLAITFPELLGAVDRYRSTGRRQTIAAAAVAAR